MERNLTACACLWKHFTGGSSRPMCSAARGPLISERKHTTPLFHASAAHLLHTHAHTTSASMHRQTRTKQSSFESLVGQEVRHSSVVTEYENEVIVVRMKTQQGDEHVWADLKNHHSTVVLCYLEARAIWCNIWSRMSRALNKQTV